MGRLENSFELMRASWEILKKDKELLFVPVISGICIMLLMTSFIAPIFIAGDSASLQRVVNEERDSLMALSFILYFLNYLIIIFFNAVIVACVMIRIGGGDPTLSDGFNVASSRIFKIVIWAFISASVGVILRMIQDRSNLLGKVIAGLAGVAWSVSCYFVVPILVNENKDPFDALMDSVTLLKKTWGEGLIGTFSFGLAFSVLSIPVILLIFPMIRFSSSLLTYGLIGVSVLYLIALSVFQSALQGIFQAALYQYARYGIVPLGFKEMQLRHAIEKRD